MEGLGGLYWRARWMRDFMAWSKTETRLEVRKIIPCCGVWVVLVWGGDGLNGFVCWGMRKFSLIFWEI